jgi:hypothetical protein
MNDRQRQQLVEQCEEAELTLLMYDYAREEGRQLAKEYDEAQENGTLPEVPEELDRKCRALIDGTFAKMERKTRLKRIVRSAARAAAVLFVVLGMMATTVMSVDALRVKVINLWIDTSEEYGKVSFDNDSIDVDLINNPYITNLENNVPEGYWSEINRDTSENFGTIRYSDGNKNFIELNILPTSSEFFIDTEDVQYEYVDVGTYSVVFSEKNGYTVIWIDKNKEIAYSLHANGLELVAFWELVYSVLAD